MTPEQEASYCIICMLTDKADCLNCKFYADFLPHPHPEQLKRASTADIERIYFELWNKPLPKG